MRDVQWGGAFYRQNAKKIGGSQRSTKITTGAEKIVPRALSATPIRHPTAREMSGTGDKGGRSENVDVQVRENHKNDKNCTDIAKSWEVEETQVSFKRLQEQPESVKNNKKELKGKT